MVEQGKLGPPKTASEIRQRTAKYIESHVGELTTIKEVLEALGLDRQARSNEGSAVTRELKKRGAVRTGRMSWALPGHPAKQRSEGPRDILRVVITISIEPTPGVELRS